jgi:hypothetical protein
LDQVTYFTIIFTSFVSRKHQSFFCRFLFLFCLVIRFGDVAERTLIGLSEHPYHQHVYPFQIASGYDNSVSSDKGYWAKGDWQDTIQSRNEDEITMKYRANVHLGKIMLHCHALVHEDFGMMTQERVLDDGDCSCNFTYDYEEK